MKLCPYCNINYSDDTLEFCLEDGTRLVSSNYAQNQIPTISITRKSKTVTDKTVNLPFSNQSEPEHWQGVKNIQPVEQSLSDQEGSTGRNNRVLEISSITFSLIHNWWQWVYLNNQYYSSLSGYVLSVNFLMWVLLLAMGIGIGLYALKQLRNKAIPITGLVILAVNLILFLVPKR